VVLKNASILITGGTGSLGKSLINHLLKDTESRRIIIFSRDELKQQNLRNEYNDNDRLRFFLGDIRDQQRLTRAMHGVDFVFHAAALKQVDTGEYNPMEFIKTNVMGSSNVIEASLDANVKRVVALSTDKASSPINLYGATKLTADKLFIAANTYGSSYGTKFSVVRYGNVMGSRGSVIPFFLEKSQRGESLPITDKRMTRFWISIEEATRFVTNALLDMHGGELYVPRIPSFRITDLAHVISPESETIEIGLRPGEKLHEEMISFDDSRRTIIENNRYVVCPQWEDPAQRGQLVPEGFEYRSDTNTDWLEPDKLRNIISQLI
jgi:UDP-N-acetylglucosamine 4,6-dehydratase